jgi:hypothetical protein
MHITAGTSAACALGLVPPRAAGGFGSAISCELARRGADIIAVDVNPADAITADMPGFAGRVAILINNAGVFREGTSGSSTSPSGSASRGSTWIPSS